jgi:hypothetical protein
VVDVRGMEHALGDNLDGCEALLDVTEWDDELTQSVRPLFPDGDGAKAEEFRQLGPVALRAAAPTPVVQASGRDLSLADRMRRTGLKVIECQGWQNRGNASLNARGSVNHHTAGPRQGDIPSLGVLINGRSDLPGPLCNVALSRSNVVYVVASGKANHAGSGEWKGLSGNSSVYGLEWENIGTSAEPTLQHQIDAMAKVHAVNSPRR